LTRIVVPVLGKVPDLRDRLARGELVRDVDRHRVADEEPRVVADDVAADVTAVAGHPLEVHVLVMPVAVVGLPQRRVVFAPVGLARKDKAPESGD